MPGTSPRLPSDCVFVDTNVFLRHLTNDLPHQAEAVERLLRQAAAGQLRLATNAMVVAEVVWTLESYYSLSKADVAARITAMLNTAGLDVADAPLLLRAIADYVDLNIDFIDAYNAAWMLQHGLSSACTFDRRHLSRASGITPLVPGEDPPLADAPGPTPGDQ